MANNTVGYDEIKGGFHFPIGVNFLQKNEASSVVVSTVCLYGMAETDPLGICEPETGYETMVFLDGSTLLSCYTRKYSTLREAKAGHKDTVDQLRAKTLPLSIPVNYWIASV